LRVGDRGVAWEGVNGQGNTGNDLGGSGTEKGKVGKKSKPRKVSRVGSAMTQQQKAWAVREEGGGKVGSGGRDPGRLNETLKIKTSIMPLGAMGFSEERSTRTGKT